jgi:predicted TIM-barrel fold metal-dependent hydrolase
MPVAAPERQEGSPSMDYKYISADDHLDLLWLPKDLWQDRLPARLKPQAPRVVETDKGTRWEWEGKFRGPSADGRDNARALQFFAKRGLPCPEGSLPPSDPALRLTHLDAAGIYATAMFGATRKWDIADDELRLAVYRAYNDWLIEFAGFAPERLIVQPILPAMMPEACEPELRRVAKLGARAVELSVFDVGKPLYDEVWEPLFAAAEEADIRICCHIGDKSGTPYPPNIRGSLLAHFSVVPFVAGPAIAQFVFSGALERHPGLLVSFAECRVGWLPFLISWMDRQVHEREPDPTAPLSLLPSEYVKRQMRFTFEDDVVGAKLIPQDWAHIKDSAMWGADYPHGQGVWFDVEARLRPVFAGLDAALVHEVTHDRAARFYGIKAPVPAFLSS